MRISDWSSDVCSSDLFTEGDQVRAGQALYQIDPAPYEAQVANARAALVRARSSIASTAALARRYNDLVKINAISRQEAENAVTSAQQAEADVSAQQAMLRSRSEEHTSELQSLMRLSYAVFCLKKKNNIHTYT